MNIKHLDLLKGKYWK